MFELEWKKLWSEINPIAPELNEIYTEVSRKHKGMFLPNNERIKAVAKDSLLGEVVIKTGSEKVISLDRWYIDHGYDPIRELKVPERKEQSVSNKSIKDLLALVDKPGVRNEVVLCLLGQPGIGKTQQVYEYAEENNKQIVEIITSQIQPSEISGIKMPEKDTQSMSVYDDARLERLKDGDILLFDELLEGHENVLSACLTLIQQRLLLSGKKLPDILIVAAANPLAAANRLKLSIRQRFIFHEVSYDKESYINYTKRTLGYDLSKELLDCLETGSKEYAEYNVLTPRSLTKLLTWAKALESKDERNYLYDIIEQDFNINVAHAIKKVVESIYVPSPTAQIIEVLNDLVENGTIVEGTEDADGIEAPEFLDQNDLEAMEPDELYEYLQARPEWNKIEEALANLTVETINDHL